MNSTDRAAQIPCILAGRRRLFVPCVCLLTAALLFPGSPLHSRQAPTISLDVKVVNVLATVRDKHDHLISNLVKEDFMLDEDGRPQTIAYFARETDLPLTLGLLIDTSGSERRVLGQERSASETFLNDMLREGKDAAFVIHFDRDAELLQDLTSSRDRLERALDRMDEPEFSSPGGNGGGNFPRGGSRQRTGGGGTVLYDSIFLASDEVIRKQQGRKALIVLSDGVDHGSKESLESAIMAAQRADTVVYSILFTGASQNPYGSRSAGPVIGRRGGSTTSPLPRNVDGKKILERISGETGGRLFEVTQKQPIDEIFKTISNELRNQYSIGYTPAATDAGAGYRRIHLSVRKKDLTVQTRNGYYADR